MHSFFTSFLQTSIVIVSISLMMLTKTIQSINFKRQVTSPVELADAAPSSKLLKQIDILGAIWLETCLAEFDVKVIQDVAIFELYYKVKSNNSTVFDWLPNEQLQWFKSNATKLDKDKKASTLLPLLYNSLQTFSSTFNEMLAMDAKNEDEDLIQRRKTFLQKLIKDLQEMLAKVGEGMDAFNLDKTTSTANKDDKWNTTPSFNSLLIQDWTVVRAYTSFLSEWLQIGKKLYQDFCDADPNPLAYCHEHLEISICMLPISRFLN